MTENRDYLVHRRAAAAEAWKLGDDAVVLVHAGQPIPKPGGQDQTYPFRPHTEYYWLAERWRPGGVVACDPAAGWTEFVVPVSEDEQLWEGAPAELPDAEGTRPIADLDDWLSERADRRIAVLGEPLAGLRDDVPLREKLRDRLLAARRPKDARELELMRRAAAATAAGYARIPEIVRPEVTEREVRLDLEAAFVRGGGDGPAYDSIVGSGGHAAVLHFEPGVRRLRDGEMVLIDAGAEVGGYACDVTRTYPVNGRFSPEQRDLYEVVLAAQEEAVAACRPGQEFRELHLRCGVTLARGLVDLGLLRGDPEALVERDAHAIFFPHGLGHLVGLGVRDASGYLPGRERSPRPGLRFLRIDLPLEEGFVTTIEPGLYFVPAIVDDPGRRRAYADDVDWERVDAWRHLGGVRIEDNVLITAAGPEVLTAAIPKASAAVEW